MQDNAVTQLRTILKGQATKPFNARGSKTKRCESCLLREDMCICDDISPQPSHAAFCLVMYKTEVLKPSNTGKLIADVVKDTHAFVWSRTEPPQALLDLLESDVYQPFVIFPEESAEPGRVVNDVAVNENKRPLFILLDGTWREARRMFRKSPWLNQYPVLSFTPDAVSNYQMRNAHFEHHMCTAEVGALALELNGEQRLSTHVSAHFQEFRKRYMANKTNKG